MEKVSINLKISEFKESYVNPGACMHSQQWKYPAQGSMEHNKKKFIS